MILKKRFNGSTSVRTPVGVVEGQVVDGFLVVDVDKSMAKRLMKRPWLFKDAGPDFQYPDFSSEKIEEKPEPKPKPKAKPRAKAKPKPKAKTKK